jgi:hypothetical protein
MCNVDSDRESATLMSARLLERQTCAVPRCIVGCVPAGRSDWARGRAVRAMCCQSRPREEGPPAQSRSPHSSFTLASSPSVSPSRPSGASVPEPWASRDAATQLAPCCGPLKQCPRHGGVCVFAARISICADIVPSRDTLPVWTRYARAKAGHGTCTGPARLDACTSAANAGSLSVDMEPPRPRQPPPPPGAQPSVRIQLDPATRVGAPLAQL